MCQRSFFSVLFVCLALGLRAGAASAQDVRYELDSEADLLEDGWTFETSGGSYAIESGQMQLDVSGFAEWMLRPETGAPWFTATDAGGWWVEARVRVDAGAGCLGAGGIGMWINEGDYLIRLHLESDLAGISHSEFTTVSMDTTDDFHVYRVQNLGNRHLQLLIDGALAIDLPFLTTPAGGTVALTFGDLGACESTSAGWDYVAYDTVAPPAPPGDDDGDGVDGPDDNCALVPNEDQGDADGDRIGDACDPCPNDAANDLDADTMCADVDPCPDDARNDSDANGVCDTEQCAEVPAGTCLALCGCFLTGGCNGLPGPSSAAARPFFPCGGFVGVDFSGGAGGMVVTGGAGGVPTGSGGGPPPTAGAPAAGASQGSGGVLSSSGGSGQESGGTEQGVGGTRPGSGGGSGRGGSSVGNGGSPPDGGEGAAAEGGSVEALDAEEDGGCACSLPGGPAESELAWLVAGALSAFATRRRRRATPARRAR